VCRAPLASTENAKPRRDLTVLPKNCRIVSTICRPFRILVWIIRITHYDASHVTKEWHTPNGQHRNENHLLVVLPEAEWLRLAPP